MKRVYITFVRDVYFHDYFDKVMGETRTSVKQKFPHDIGDPFCVASLTINENNTQAKVIGRLRETLNAEETDKIISIVDYKTFLILVELCVKSNIIHHD